MTQTRRWRSSEPHRPALWGGKAIWLLLLTAVSLLLFSLPRFTLLRPELSQSTVTASHLFFPLIAWAFLSFGPIWGTLGASVASLAAAIAALGTRQYAGLLLPVEFAAFAFLVQWGHRRWQESVAVSSVKQEHLQAEANTLVEEIRHLQELFAALQDRLQRYQQLRQVANAFSASFSIDDLIEGTVQATGNLVQRADLVLLYLMDRRTLTLELKSVWRRAGAVTVKAKRGDTFDMWVVRQAQPLLVQEPDKDFRFSQVTPQEVGRPLGALLSVPLFSEDRMLGVLRVESSRRGGLGPDDLRFVHILGDLASLGIANSQLYNRMADLASTDDLTGLAVKIHFQKRLAEEIARSKGLQIPAALLLIDIDHFKIYNDTFGHSAGDKLLKHLAQLLLKMRRPGDLVARFGGEEFVFLMPGTQPSEAAARAEAIRAQVESSQVELRRSMTQATVSIGAAGFPKDAATAEALLKTADDRLYRAKAQGRNRVCSS